MKTLSGFKRVKSFICKRPPAILAAATVNFVSDAALFFLRDSPSIEAAGTFWVAEIIQFVLGEEPWGYSIVNAGFAVGMNFLRHSSGVSGNHIMNYTLPALECVFGAGAFYYPILKGGEFLQKNGFRSAGNALCTGAKWLKPTVGLAAVGLHVISIYSSISQGLQGDHKKFLVAGVQSGWIAGDVIYNEILGAIKTSYRNIVKRTGHSSLITLNFH